MRLEAIRTFVTVVQATLGLGFAVPAEASLAFNLAGDALRNQLDPRRRGR